MQYGYFDNEKREYVITRPDTPTPWINYLGNGGFGGIISNNAGGLVFDGDPGKRRLTRYRHNNLPMDRPGRYLYIKDMDSGEYWSPTWQPVLKDLDAYECRHGLSYTVISSEYSKVSFEAVYCIPLGKSYEVWKCKLKNQGDSARNLKLFPYMEFSWFDASVDTLMEWGRYNMKGHYENGTIIYEPASMQFIHQDFFGYFSTSLPIEGYDCTRDKFIGAYRNEQNPIAVEKGICSNSDIDGDHVCAAFACPVTLMAGEELEFTVVIGASKNKKEISAAVEEALDINNAVSAIRKIKAYWTNYLDFCQIHTPDAEMNQMINIWHAYQCRTTFDWSRFISYYERGSDRGWGFRDSMQDVLGVMHAIPELAKERIKTLLRIQCRAGDAKCVYYPGTGKATEKGGRSDDHLWSIYSVCSYIKETGDYAFLNEVVPYVDGGEDTVKDHLIRGLEFSWNHRGEHGITRFLNNDWNDSMAPIGWGGKSESTFVFFQAATAAKDLIELFEHIGDEENAIWAKTYYENCRQLYKQLWDGGWFIRAYLSDGRRFGTNEDEYNKIFLNPQSWAVLSGLPTEEEANLAFDNVYKYLFTEFGLISHFPPSTGFSLEDKSFFAMSKGLKENGGVFFHANTWAVIAETMLNRAEEAFEIYKASIPCKRNELADWCLTEPYVYGSAQVGPAHERFGTCSNSWLTGTASWMYYAVTRYMLGFRPEYDGIVFDPCVPKDWNGYSLTRVYRNIHFKVTVEKLPYNGAKPTALEVDGTVVEGNYLAYEKIRDKTHVEVIVKYDQTKAEEENL